MSPIKSLGKHTAVYGAGIVLGKLASFIMLPVYTRYLTPADYGVLELLGMTIEIIGMFAGIGLASSVFKFYADAEGKAAKDTVVSTAAIGAAGLAAAAAALGLLAAPLLSRLVIGPEGNPTYFRLFFLIYFCQNFEYVPLMLLRAQRRSTTFVAINVAKLVAMLSLNILFVVHLRMGVMGVLASNLITATVLATGLTVYLVRQVGVSFSPERFRAMTRFGSPMVLWSLGSFVLVFSDRYFLQHFTDTATVGIYALAYKFAFVLGSLAYAPFRQVWDPQRFEIAKRPDAREIFSRVFLYVNVALGMVALLICLFVRDLLGVMSAPAFLPAYRVVPLLLASQIAFLWVGYCNLGLFVKGRTGTMGTVGVVGVVTTILLNLVLIPEWGMFGAAWATAAAYGLRFVWVYRAAQREYPVPYPWWTVARLYAVLGTAVAARFLVQPSGLAASLGWSAVLLFAAGALVYTQIVGARERAFVRDLVGRVRTFRFLPA